MRRSRENKDNVEPGTLYVVATPIGNLGDIAPRAVSVLEQVDLILAEDTRHFGKLAAAYGIKTPKQSYHEHNEKVRAEKVVKLLGSGKSAALVSDAGTPTISDPGYRVINECHKHNVPVKCIPGPSALTAALSVAGFPTDAFIFEGFLPIKSGKKQKALEQALSGKRTTVFFESPHRIVKTLTLLVELDSSREIFIGRELSKVYEETSRGTAKEILELLKTRQQIKGEFTLILRGHTQ